MLGASTCCGVLLREGDTEGLGALPFAGEVAGAVVVGSSSSSITMASVQDISMCFGLNNILLTSLWVSTLWLGWMCFKFAFAAVGRVHHWGWVRFGRSGRLERLIGCRAWFGRSSSCLGRRCTTRLVVSGCNSRCNRFGDGPQLLLHHTVLAAHVVVGHPVFRPQGNQLDQKNNNLMLEREDKGERSSCCYLGVHVASFLVL